MTKIPTIKEWWRQNRERGKTKCEHIGLPWPWGARPYLHHRTSCKNYDESKQPYAPLDEMKAQAIENCEQEKVDAIQRELDYRAQCNARRAEYEENLIAMGMARRG